MTAGAWSVLAASATAGTTNHYTPWWLAVLVIGMAVFVTIWRRRDGGTGRSGRSGRGPSGGS